ncbi:uncharacterized protein LOC128203066 [Mya arenaria]|uniref:uncharacterized protein LOC128203066 n=1 Tax=Mya arenaria TaxID=6604 RepID=UPI0022E093D6|nr:uncharacterized protein LOC128203066 [Mya arenaria]
MDICKLLLTMVIALSTWTQAVFVKQSIPVPEDKYVIACPSECQCSHKEMTAECQFDSYEDYSMKKLLPWQLTVLRIHGTSSTWQTCMHSVKHVLLKGLEDVENTEDSFNDVFSGLRSLDIQYIPVEKISNSDLMVFKNLSFLSLSHSKISAIESHAFDTMSYLETLKLSWNNISTLGKYLFKDLKALIVLDVGYNSIEKLDAEDLNGLFSLEVLDLQSNLLRQVETFILDLNLNALQSLNLRSNKLSYISKSGVEQLLRLSSVDLSSNAFECTCMNEELIRMHMLKPTLFETETSCSGPKDLNGMKFKELDIYTLPCKEPEISNMTNSLKVNNQENLVIRCNVQASAPFAVYWVTPLGDKFTQLDTKETFPDQYEEMMTEKTYYGHHSFLVSKIYMTRDFSLVIETVRGYFDGEFVCVAENSLGSVNESTTIAVTSEVKTVYINSIFIGAYTSSAMLFLGTLIGLVRMLLNKCCHIDKCCCCSCSSDDLLVVDKRKNENGNIETTYANSDSIGYMDEDSIFQSGRNTPPDPPVNSPTLRCSPDKCVTPTNSEMDPSKGSSQHIWEQLDEVRSRLYYGAGRKIEKVRSHVRSFTDTGSLKIREMKDAGSMKIQSIKESGSHAASVAKKTVTSGMFQVKYSVQSIKEFCGTGEMGPGTVSMVSVSTDVDTHEEVKIVRSHTFV